MNVETDILGARILIVDDQEADVTLLCRLLGDAGYTHVSATRDPAQVHALHGRDEPDLILLDLQSPVLDGFGVMGRLKAETPDTPLPVIALTAQPGLTQRALQAGAKDFIAKPFDQAEVKARIHNMLEVRLLYRQLQAHNAALEKIVAERTAELRASEERYRRLAELAADGYWEQDEAGVYTRVSGRMVEMLGLGSAPGAPDSGAEAQTDGWNNAEREALHARIAERRPFLDFAVHRRRPDGSWQQFRISGEPMFDAACGYIGYRGVGVEVAPGA